MTIVAAYLPTTDGRDVVAAAATQARLHEERLVVVNAASGAAVADPALAPPEELDRLRDDLRREGIDATVHQVRKVTSVAEALLDVVREEDASLLVIGTRRRSVVGKFLLGSTAQSLILDAPCSVLAVKSTTAHDRGSP